MSKILRNLIDSLEKRLAETTDTDKALALADRLMEAYDKLPDKENLWDVKRAAEFLKIKPDTLYKWTSQQKVPFIPVGSTRRFDPATLKKWVIKNTIRPHRAWRK